MSQLTVFTTPTTVSRETLQTLSALPGYDVEEVSCPQSATEWFLFPFLRDEEGVPYYGSDGIDFFIDRTNRRVL